MSLRRLATLVPLLWWCCLPAAAQTVSLEFHDGGVSLRAQNAPVSVILAEWARLGGMHIVNGEHMAGPPLTLELADVPETLALDIVLRNASGYAAAWRHARSVGRSTFARILILPTSRVDLLPRPTTDVQADQFEQQQGSELLQMIGFRQFIESGQATTPGAMLMDGHQGAPAMLPPRINETRTDTPQDHRTLPLAGLFDATTGSTRDAVRSPSRLP